MLFTATKALPRLSDELTGWRFRHNLEVVLPQISFLRSAFFEVPVFTPLHPLLRFKDHPEPRRVSPPHIPFYQLCVLGGRRGKAIQMPRFS